MNEYTNVLVTGSSGQLGTELYNLVKNKLNTKDQQKFIFLNRNELDITNKEDTQKFIKDNNIKLVINCAAYTNVELAEEQAEQCFLVNSSGVGNIVSGLESVEGSLIHISTDYVFDGESKMPLQFHLALVAQYNLSSDQYLNHHPIISYSLANLLGLK